jgi:glycosyltransferase involved in cell wall biosynthesis
MHFTYLYLHLPEVFRFGTALIEWLEGYSPSYLDELTSNALKFHSYIQPRVKHRFAITDYVAKKSQEQYGLESKGVIPVGVDTGFFVPPLQRGNDVPVALFVGHLIQRKGPQYVVRAAQHFPNVRFLLVGRQSGRYYQTLCSMVEAWKLDNVTFRGPVGREPLLRLMQSSDLLLHPSLSEGLPKVVMEGAATGLPAIIFNHYQAPAVRDGVTGFQVGTFEEMLDRLRRLIENRALRHEMAQAAVQHARQFDWGLVTKQWEKVFQTVLLGRA